LPIIEPLYGIQAPNLPPWVLLSVEQDASLNKLSGDTGEYLVTLPQFTERLLDGGLIMQMGWETRTRSCAFDLAGRLGLLPGQPNESRGEFETVALDNLVHNGSTYCARISHHYLVLLISEHVQDVWQDGIRTHASTDIGHFTIYEHEGRSMVHFDGSHRSSSVLVIAPQILSDIQEAARGGYKLEINGNFVWRRCTPFEFALTFCKPETQTRAVLYLRRRDVEEWRLIKSFAIAVGYAMRRIMESVRAPDSFVAARETNWLATANRNKVKTVSERLAAAVQLLTLGMRGYLDRPDAVGGLITFLT